MFFLTPTKDMFVYFKELKITFWHVPKEFWIGPLTDRFLHAFFGFTFLLKMFHFGNMFCLCVLLPAIHNQDTL